MDILEKFKDYLKRNELKAPSFHPYFEEALNYMLKAGGKHFRAQLLLGVVWAVEDGRAYIKNTTRSRRFWSAMR